MTFPKEQLDRLANAGFNWSIETSKEYSRFYLSFTDQNLLSRDNRTGKWAVVTRNTHELIHRGHSLQAYITRAVLSGGIK